jgi:hypothetical protein
VAQLNAIARLSKHELLASNHCLELKIKLREIKKSQCLRQYDHVNSNPIEI